LPVIPAINNRHEKPVTVRTSMKRRDFIKFAVGAAAGLAASPAAFKLAEEAALWSQNPPQPLQQNLLRGKNTYAYTTSKLCSSACGIKVRILNGNILRTLPSPEHPLGGGVSALAIAEPALMHSPARVTAPLLRNADGSFKAISWSEAEKTLQQKLQEAGANILCLSGDENGSSGTVLSSFLKGLNSDKMYFMPSEAQCASLAWQMAHSVQPGASSSVIYRTANTQLGYELEKAGFILAIGANFLENWGTFIRNRRIFAQKNSQKTAKDESGFGFIYAGPAQNQTAAVAQQWVAIKPGAETIFALGIAAMLIQKYNRKFSDRGFTSIERHLEKFDPDYVFMHAGVSPNILEYVAEKLIRAQNPLVLCASEFNQGAGLGPPLVGSLLNLLLRGPICSIHLHTTSLPGAKTRAEIFRNDFLKDIHKNGGAIPAKLAVFYEANPAYALPGSQKIAGAIAKTPCKISFTPFMDETALLCDLVLPTPLGLEKLDDIESPYGCGKGFYALCRPLIAPVVSAYRGPRHGLDVLLKIAPLLNLRLPATYEEVLKNKAKELALNWNELLDGKAFERAPAAIESASFDFNLYERLVFEALKYPPPEAGITLTILSRCALGTAQTGLLPFSLNTVWGKELHGADIVALMNTKTAQNFLLADRDKINIRSGVMEISAQLRIFEGITDNAVALSMGFGHTAPYTFSRNKGANVFDLLMAQEERGSGLMVWNQTNLDITKQGISSI
jgi:anaerobic selenocysteine-containing dehydrogenase